MFSILFCLFILLKCIPIFFFIILLYVAVSDNKNIELVLSKSELDYAHKDEKHKHYPSDFKVKLYMLC